MTTNDFQKKVLSIITPVYDEEESIELFLHTIVPVLENLNSLNYEIVFIDDGSKDKTLQILSAKAIKDERIKVLSFSRNFGKEKAMYCGLQFCNGDAAVIIDVDLQDPVDLIYGFVEKWREGYQNVYGIRSDRSSDTIVKRWTANLFYKFINKITDTPVYQNVGDFRLIDRRIIDSIKKIGDKELFMKYIFNWAGFNSTGIGYVRSKRLKGKTKFNYWRLWNFALDGIIASSTIPLRIWTYIGCAISTVGILRGVYIAVRTLIFGIDLPGYASLTCMIAFLGGIQLISIGIIGEYLGRLVKESKNRPLYILREQINI
jgi:glycosyltransferase involved in cell wall biosynthesis